MTTLISFLGKGLAGGYRPANYVLEGQVYADKKYLGLVLSGHLKPERLILLGTAGSMWDVFLQDSEGLDDELLGIMDAVPSGQVTAAQLQPFSRHLSQKMGIPVHCELIPYGRTLEEQTGILARLAELVPAGEPVCLDVTHGFRHLPMLALVAARFLAKVQKNPIQGIYYGALDMTEAGQTPVLQLHGLLELLDWVDGITTFDKDGDYGVFAPLLQKEGLPEVMGQQLKKAAFLERISNSSGARQALQTIAKTMENLDTPIYRLFRGQLLERLKWFRLSNRGAQEMQLARDYLARRDYLRAVLYGLEGLISSRVKADGRDEHDFDDRDDMKERLKKESESFKKLNHLRNGMAHGSRPDNTDTRSALQDEARLAQSLTSRFDHLLD